MRNEKLDTDDRLAYNEQYGFYYYKNSDKIAALFVAQDVADTGMDAISASEAYCRKHPNREDITIQRAFLDGVEWQKQCYVMALRSVLTDDEFTDLQVDDLLQRVDRRGLQWQDQN